MARVLYITYDGVLEPLAQSQVLAYLEVLSADHAIWLISFEKADRRCDGAAISAMRRRLRDAGIRWTQLAYHRTPTAPATGWDVAVGTAVALWLVVTRRLGIVHARSYVPALIALAVKRLTGAHFVFDMRGFWADERVDGGLWPAGGWLYHVAKRFERSFLRHADHVVTLTRAGAAELERHAPVAERRAAGDPPAVSVIPTCANLARFSLRPRPPRSPFVLGHVGSIAGTWYMLDETVTAFAAVLARRPDAVLHVVNRAEHDLVRAAVARAGIAPDRLEICAAEHAEVPQLVGRMHAACCLIRPVYSKIGSAPTKLAEYLGCGVPCLGNKGVGDMAGILEENRVGVALEDFGPEAMGAGVDRLLALADEPGIRERCARVAARLFSLESGAAEYGAIYDRLARDRRAVS